MPQRPDLRQISGNIREALGDCDRETLLDMLTFVFKEYVVEGPPPLLVSHSERIPDLEGLTFAQLIRTLQTRLDLPELNLFQVDGEQVSVRVGGVMTPLDTSRARGGVEPPAPAAAPATPERPAQPGERRPGVHIIEAQVPMQPPRRGAERGSAEQQGAPDPSNTANTDQAGTGRSGAGQGAAPPPRRGLSVRGRPGAGAAPRQASSEPGQAGQPGDRPSSSPPERPPGPAAGQPSSQPSPQSGDEDIASTRFSLLELD